MKKYLLLLIIVALGIVGYWLMNKNNPTVSEPMASNIMKLTSKAFTNNGNIPALYTCDGKNINPPLAMADIPAGTKSLTLIVDDPDAPAGTWVHWLVWNIKPFQTEILANSVPAEAVQGSTSFGKAGYGGPCPPSGTHHYYFKIYALDTTLSLQSIASKDELLRAMTNHILDETELIGLYKR